MSILRETYLLAMICLIGTNLTGQIMASSLNPINNITVTTTIISDNFLVNFEANVKENFVELQWTTAKEMHQEHFMVERSLDQKNWEAVGQMGMEGMIEGIHFESVDLDPYQGHSYYRLKRNSNNLNPSYSGTKMIFIDADNLEMSIAPQNEKGYFVITVNQPLEAFNAFVINGRGKMIEPTLAHAKPNIMWVDMKDFAKGIYLLKVKANDRTYEEKIEVK